RLAAGGGAAARGRAGARAPGPARGGGACADRHPQDHRRCPCAGRHICRGLCRPSRGARVRREHRPRRRRLYPRDGRSRRRTREGAMNDAARPRRRERANRSAGIRQLPFARVRNPYRPMELLSADQIESIHHASLKLLAEVGVEVMHDESRRILRQAGADVDEATQRVRCDPAMIEAEIAKAPHSFTILTRDPAKSMVLGEGEVVFSSVGGPAFANDLDRGRRAGNSADMRDYIKLVQSLNVIHQEGGGPIEPTDLPAESRHLDFYEAVLTLTDKSWECWALGGYRVRDAVEMISIAYGIPRDQMDRQVTAITVINSNSPLRLDGPMGEGLVELARSGQASILTPFTLAG